MATEANFKDTLLLTLAGAMTNEQFGEAMKGLLVQKGRGAVNLSPAEIVRDMFLEGDLHKVPTKQQLEVGKPEAATGANSESMVREYSDFAPQIPRGRVENYEKLESMFGEMKGAMKALADGMVELTKLTAEAAKAKTPEVTVKSDEEEEEVEVTVNEKEDEDGKGKSLRAQATKAILAKAEEEEEEEGKDGEEEEEEETGKSLSDPSKVRFAKALLGGAEDAIKKGDPSKGLTREVEKTARKAYKLAASAVESKDKDVAKAAKSAMVEVEEFMFLHDIATKAKKNAKNSNQKKWPDHDGMEKSLTDMQASLTGLMNVVENISRSRGAPGVEVLGVNSPLSKGGADYFTEKLKLIQDRGDAGMLSEDQQGLAEEMISMMQAVSKGQLSESVVRNTLSVANPAVKSVFLEWFDTGAKS